MIKESGYLVSYDPTVFPAGWKRTMLVFLDPRHPGRHFESVTAIEEAEEIKDFL